MPGFLMHLLEGNIILENFKRNKIPFYDAASKAGQQFLLGTLLPDITNNKELTHFRPEYQKHLITKYPDIDYILQRYNKSDFSPFDLGILAHLHLDAVYVKDFWPNYFSFQNDKGMATRDTREALYVNIFSTNEVIPLKEFFSDKYFYGDYDILNPILMNTYDIQKPDISFYNKKDIHISECAQADASDIISVIEAFTSWSDTTSNNTTRVFPASDIINFINAAALLYAEKYIS
jgi:hypothetical protein